MASTSLSTSLGTAIPDNSASFSGSPTRGDETPGAGHLIINADDWGRDTQTTQRIFECVSRGSVSAVSAMVFMEDSERAAAMAREEGVDAGLHLNFTTPFSAANCPARLMERQLELASCLLRHPLARVLYHPWLARSFECVAQAQLDEFRRLYGMQPERLDGHHHMHLSSNVLFGALLPRGALVRRHFSRESGEKTLRNSFFRKYTDAILARRHRTVDFLFSLAPLEPPDRLQRIFSLARQFVVEVETHPVSAEEYQFLTADKFLDRVGTPPTAFRVAMAQRGGAGSQREFLR